MSSLDGLKMPGVARLIEYSADAVCYTKAARKSNSYVQWRLNWLVNYKNIIKNDLT